VKTVFSSGAHTKHRLLFHIVFIPKYRKRVLRYSLEKRLRYLITQCCEINNWIIFEMEILPDHVHLLIQIKPKDSISSVMHRIKGGTSRMIRKEFPELEEFLWGDSFWSDGYFAETIGRVNEKVILNYIQNQQNKQVERTHGF
jgi:putative transposase